MMSYYIYNNYKHMRAKREISLAGLFLVLQFHKMQANTRMPTPEGRERRGHPFALD